MMGPFTSYRSPQEVCKAIGAIAQQRFQKLSPRPWNRYEPDESSWWLVPSGDLPAYRYGKFYFDWAGSDRSALLCGLYMEKGIGEEAAQAYLSPKGRRYIMDSGWSWFTLLRDLQHGIRNVVEALGQSLPFPIEFRIDGGYVSDPESFDRYASDLPWDVYTLHWLHSRGVFELAEAKREAKLLDQLGGVTNFAQLFEVLDSLSQNPWLWLDVFICIRLQIAVKRSSETETSDLWQAGTMWDRFLSHLIPWVT